jgi:hypothetical protein
MKKRIVYNPNVRVHYKVHSYRLRWSFIIRRVFNMGRSRHMLKKYYGRGSDKNILSTEFPLLRKIFSKISTLPNFHLGVGKSLAVFTRLFVRYI